MVYNCKILDEHEAAPTLNALVRDNWKILAATVGKAAASEDKASHSIPNAHEAIESIV